MRNENKRAAILYAALSIASLLALLLTACSENLEESPVAGTPAGQHPIAQTQDSLSAENALPVAGDSVVATDSSTHDSNVENSNVYALLEKVLISKNYDIFSQIFSGYNKVNAFAKIYELDSVTLDTTGEFFHGSYDEASRTFHFESGSVNSPYVLVEVCWSIESECTPKENWEFTFGEDLVFRKIVDLRKKQNVIVDAIGHLESYRITRLAQSGQSYEIAKQHANRDILDAFGFFKNSFDLEQCENLSYDDSVALNFITGLLHKGINSVVLSVGQYGSLDSLSDSVRQEWLWSQLRILEYDVLDSNESSSWVTARSNFVAVLRGFGECTSAKEGAVVETTYKTYNLVCKSGNWGVANNVALIDSAGMMTDLRDGKKYKTVSYNIMGVTETWMAEDLMFSSLDGNYVYPDAIALDSSVVMQSFDECFEYELAYAAKEVGGPKELTATDSSMVQSMCERYQKNKSNINYERFWPAVDSVMGANGLYQGICPDGWHLPSGYEWERLMRYVADTYDKSGSYSSATMYLETAGFGSVLLPDDIHPGQTKETYYAMKPDSSYRAIGFEDAAPLITYMRFVGDYWDILARAMNTDHGSVVRVRCIKN